MNNRQRKRANIYQNTPAENESPKQTETKDEPAVNEHEVPPVQNGGSFNNKFDYFNNKPSKYYNISYSYYPIQDELVEGEPPKVAPQKQSHPYHGFRSF